MKRLIAYWHPGGKFKPTGLNRRTSSIANNPPTTYLEQIRYGEISWDNWARPDRSGLTIAEGWFVIEAQEQETNDLGEIHP